MSSNRAMLSEPDDTLGTLSMTVFSGQAMNILVRPCKGRAFLYGGYDLAVRHEAPIRSHRDGDGIAAAEG